MVLAGETANPTVGVRMNEGLLVGVDEWRAQQWPIPSRAKPFASSSKKHFRAEEMR
jgi:hypothetical protein